MQLLLLRQYIVVRITKLLIRPKLYADLANLIFQMRYQA